MSGLITVKQHFPLQEPIPGRAAGHVILKLFQPAPFSRLSPASQKAVQTVILTNTGISLKRMGKQSAPNVIALITGRLQILTIIKQLSGSMESILMYLV
jgi:hypothetical protein